MLQVAPPRLILHADLDAFFASVEQLDDPSKCGKPVLVGGRSKRGVVAAASYEARAFGCRSAMPMARALALCPHAIVAPARFARYAELSGRFMAVLGRYSPLVESLSVDEAFVDCTGSVRLHGDGPTIGRSIRAAVHAETGLTASVGVGPNKFVAKLATDVRKPDGMTVAPAEGLAAWLAPFGIERMWGVGPRTLPRFHAAGIRTFGDLQRMEAEELAARLGDHALAMQARALGHDDRAVEPEHERKGVGHETTFHDDLDDPEDVLDALHELTEGACLRLRAAGAVARRVTVKIRYGDFETVTRSSTLREPTDRTLVLLAAAKELFRRWAAAGFVPVRLVGVRLECGDAGDGTQGLLFGDPRADRERAVDRVADAIAHRFGKDAIARGGQRRAGGQHSSPQSSE